MNCKSVIIALALAVCACTQLPQNRIIEHPEVAAAAQTNLDLLRVDMTDSTTTLTFEVNFRPGLWISIAPESYIEAAGQRYTLQSATGIVPGEDHTMSPSGCDTFSLVFPAIPAATTTLDFSEGEGGWAVYGIDLTGRGRGKDFASWIPSDAGGEGEIFADPVMAADTTELRIHLFDYRPVYGDKLNVEIYNAYNGRGESFAGVPVDSMGNASLSAVLYGTSRVAVKMAGIYSPAVLVAPGGVTDIYIDPAFTAGRKDGVVYTADNGRYAALNKSLAKLAGDYRINYRSGDLVRYDASPQEYAASAAVARMNAYNDIDTLNAPEALDAYLKACVDIDYLFMLIEQQRVLATSYMKNHNALCSDSLGAALPDEVFTASTVDLDNPMLRMCSNYPRLIATDPARFGNYPRAAADHLFAEKFAAASLAQLSEDDLDTLSNMDNAFYARAAAMCQAVNEKRFEELQSAVHATPAVPSDKLFEAIVAPYRGKVVLVDLWNTWCGPCRNALKANEPLKSGELANDDIVWLYIADTSSDTSLYASMIKDIKGEHYMVNEEQIGAIRRQFEVDGIPYYILVDRQGHAVGHPDFRDHSLLVSGIKEKL